MYAVHLLFSKRFNSQPPEGGWPNNMDGEEFRWVSTHSRLKAAGFRLP